MELEVGMYVRTKYGIAKIEEDRRIEYGMIHPVIDILKKEAIFKASHNIIDLIEVGDYVNGHQVYEIDRKCCRITLNGGSYGDEFRITYLRPALGENMGIKSIVTREQFSAMEYRLGDK